MILIEKDEWEDKAGNKHEWNAQFQKYYNSFSWFSMGFNYSDDGLFSDGLRKVGTSWMNMEKATSTVLRQNQSWGYVMEKSWPSMWEEISEEIDAIRVRDYWEYWEKWKRADLKNLLNWFIKGLREANWLMLKSILTDSTSPLYLKLRDWWVNFSEVVDNPWELNNIIDRNIDKLLGSSNSNSVINNTRDWFSNALNRAA
jgi:hypothetical protein